MTVLRGPRLAVVVALVIAGCGGQLPAAAPGATAQPTAAGTALAATTATATPEAASTATPTPTTTAPAATATPRPTPSHTTTTTTITGPTLAQMIGQKLVVRMSGTSPSADLLGRIRRGEIGGVILFGFNISTKSALLSLTAKLRAAAVAGHQPKFLVSVDQEGGSIKRIPWAPPTLSPPQMGVKDSTTIARTQGANTAAALKALGINVDFAPVADVPESTSSFMYQQGRTWSFSAVHTAALSDAFATGLESKGVVPSMKHFPGIGFANLNTDSHVVTIGVSRTRLLPGLKPYRTAISHHIPLIMLSNATYTAYDTRNAAGWSTYIGTTLLRHDLGFKGVTITDSINGTAAARHLSATTLAVRAARAGTDMILTTGTEASTRAIYATLLADARAGTISRTTLRASYDRILALKAGL